MIKVLENLGTDGTYLNIIKAIYNKPLVIICGTEKRKALPLKSGIGQDFYYATHSQSSSHSA